MRVECDQRRGDVICIDAAQADARSFPTRVQERSQERREVGAGITTVGSEVDAAEHDLAVAGVDRGMHSLVNRASGNARGHAARLPHDAVRTTMVASVLHLDEGAGAHRRGIALLGRERCHREHVFRDALLVPIGEDRVDRRVRTGVCVDAASREHEMRVGINAPQPPDALARGRVRLGGHGAGVEHAHIRSLGLRHDVAPTGGEPSRQVRHLGEVHLAPEHRQRDPERTIQRCGHDGAGAAAASRSPAPARSSEVATAPASRLGKTRLPRWTRIAPEPSSKRRSAASRPPSGPMTNPTATGGSGTARRIGAAP